MKPRPGAPPRPGHIYTDSSYDEAARLQHERSRPTIFIGSLLALIMPVSRAREAAAPNDSQTRKRQRAAPPSSTAYAVAYAASAWLSKRACYLNTTRTRRIGAPSADPHSQLPICTWRSALS